MASLVALVGALAVNQQHAAAMVGVTKEAQDVARVVSFLLMSGSNKLSESAQEIVAKLHKTQGRDVVLVDSKRLVLADALPSQIGKSFTEDPGGEVEATIKDRQVRTFVEVSQEYPAGIKQIVVPVEAESGQVIGAVVLEYTPLYNELMRLTRSTIRHVALAGLGSVAIGLLIAFYMGRSIARPLQQLTNVATGFAFGRRNLPMPSPRKDEIGELATAFNNMVQKRQRAEDELRRLRDELEARVTARVAELAEANEALANDISERKRAEEALQRQQTELRVLFDLVPAMIFFKDMENGILRVNKRFAETVGKSVEEIEGKPYRENPSQEAAKFYADDLEVIHSGVPKLGIVETLRDRQGKEVWMQTDKVPVCDKDGKVIGIVVMCQDITERKRAEEALLLLNSAVLQSREAILITDAELDLPGPRIVFVNPAFTKMTGYHEEEVFGKTPRILQGPGTDRTVLDRLRQNLERGEGFEGEAINYRKDGTEFDMQWQIAPIRNASGTITHFVANQRDITTRKRFEAQLFQSQKLETVGKLAGGVAHEFNSIITAIIGQSELLLADLPAGSPLAKSATEIGEAASRAATLTRQLQAYGRKQLLKPETLDLNSVIAGMEGMFHHLMGSDVDTQIVPAVGLQTVKADAGQIEQVILNMAINARDAMPSGGKFMLETANISFDEESVGRYPELKPGDYVMLAITDTGRGMSAEEKARVFEPFFSTKDVGQGTGLGLSICYGIIKQSGGHISVYSELARGTTFKIYLPQVEHQIPIQRFDSPDLPRGTETILLVEDDPALREMAATLLRRLGYTVLAAANGIEALSLKHRRDIGHIDLLFSDVVMPHMSGKELSERMRAIYPHTRILFTSAYTENAIIHQGVLNKGLALLQKPFTPSALAHKLREVLDQPANRDLVTSNGDAI